MVKNPSANPGDVSNANSIHGLERSFGEVHGNPLQYFFPGESHRQRSLVGYGPQGQKESDTTEVT